MSEIPLPPLEFRRLVGPTVWTQLPRATPSGCVGPKYTVVAPSASAAAAGEG
jgi:hypothetical protein